MLSDSLLKLHRMLLSSQLLMTEVTSTFPLCSLLLTFTTNTLFLFLFTPPAPTQKIKRPMMTNHIKTGSQNPYDLPYGLRFRLKSSFNITGYSQQSQVLLQALKTYGMFFADQGNGFYIQGESSPTPLTLISPSLPSIPPALSFHPPS